MVDGFKINDCILCVHTALFQNFTLDEYHALARTKQKGSCKQKTIRDNELEDQIMKELDAIAIPTEFRELAMKIIGEDSGREFSDKKTMISSQQKAYNACVAEYDGLVTMRAKGQIDEETFLRKKAILETERKRLMGLLEETDKAVDDWLERAEYLFNFAEVGKIRFERGTIEEKKDVLSYLGSNLLLKDRKLRITRKNELIAMEELAKEEKAIRNRLEPLGFGSDKTKLWAEYAQSPMMLRRQDSNLRPGD